MKFKNVILIVFSSLFGATLAIAFNRYYNDSKEKTTLHITESEIAKPVIYKNNSPVVNFTSASSIATPAVVHVNTKYTIQNNAQQFYGDDLFQYFFGTPQQRQQRESSASGSGVVVSSDGYIITNNHVIENANDIQVNLSNNKTYKATLIGSDKDTDLALIKIDTEEDLPYLNFANSDDVLVGEWVLAVGNPFNLASTVTAGIVSAKGRNINLLQNIQGQSNTAIESFIQTDAAINPGNSGGALVNTDGDLIGINTAIATPTGTYAGYAFAVPSNIVYKVMNDLKEFGIVQRAFLGVNISSVDNEIAEKLELKSPNGVYIESVMPGGSADEAGLKAGDVITKIEGEKVNSVAELQEKISSYSPGNVIEVSFLRKNKLLTQTISLKNKFNSKELVHTSTEILNRLGLSLEEAKPNELLSVNLRNGVKVKSIDKKGMIHQYTDMREDFIITMVDNIKIKTIDDFANAMSNKKGNVLIEGKYLNNKNAYLYALKIE